MKEIEIKLTLDELNLVLEAIGEKPYSRVYQLVDKIQQQAVKQLNNNPSIDKETDK